MNIFGTIRCLEDCWIRIKPEEPIRWRLPKLPRRTITNAEGRGRCHGLGTLHQQAEQRLSSSQGLKNRPSSAAIDSFPAGKRHGIPDCSPQLPA